MISDIERPLLVISAHPGDFVWRASGALATASRRGQRAVVLTLSYGERGEAGELWKEDGQTVENVKRIRHQESVTAAEAVGAEFRCLDLGDYPLVVEGDAFEQVVETIREIAPGVLLTHTGTDPFNPDHALTHDIVDRARMLSAGANVASGFKTVQPPQFLLFEPHQSELSDFTPTTFLDITGVYEQKEAAMAAMGAQSYLPEYYAQRATARANHARRVSGQNEVRYAEAFQRVIPDVVPAL